MRRVARAVGWILVVLGGLLVLAAVATWPPGGLMFALPFVFLMPGALLAAIGGLLLLVGREPPVQRDDGPESPR
jgi:hypothetical protein